MSKLFLHVFNIAVTAGWIVLACLVIRWCLRRRLTAWFRVALWGVVAARLLFPFSLESVLSLIPSAEAVPPTITTSPAPTVNVGVPVVDQVINPVISQTMAPVPQASVNPMQVVVTVGAAIWLLGVAVILTAWLVQMIRLRREVSINRYEGQGVYACDGLPTAFVLGVLRPKIYIPSGMDPQDREYVLAHERMHIRRGDHVFQFLGVLLLTVYWFHPLLWVAYKLYCRDVEVACDEAVLNKLGEAHTRRYALALVNCAANRARVYKYNPLSFGESHIKERVKHMMNYKKPKLWVTVIAVALIAATAVCFLTNPVSADEPENPLLPPNTQETTGTEQPTEQPTEEVTTAPEEVVSDLVNEFGVIPAETVKEMKQRFIDETRFNLTHKDVFLHLFGVFNDAYAVYTEFSGMVYFPGEYVENVCNYTFKYGNQYKIEIYYHGIYYSVSDAYSTGIISAEDVGTLYENYCKAFMIPS